MKILFFFWFVFMVNASNNVELQKSYRAKDYQTVVGMAEKYPSLFSANAENLSVLALAQYHLNNWHLAVKTCALVQNIEPMRTCSNLVQKVKKDKKELFDLGLGIYEYELHNHKRAFAKFSKLVEEFPDNDLYRTWLMMNLYAFGFLDYALEQLWEIEEVNEEVRLIRRTIEAKKRSLRAWFQQLPLTPTVEQADNIYYYLFLEQKNIPEQMEFLRTVYSQEKESFGFSQKNALRNANLMFIEGKIKDLKRHLSVISDQIVEPLYRFSLDSLYRRIARLESADIPEEMRALQARQGYSATAKLSSTTKTSTGQISAVPETDPEAEEKKNATFDFSDLMFATPEDLGAYQAIYQEFNKVLDNNPNMSVKRWLYKQIDDVADEMFAKESSAISAQAFSRTREGRGLIDKMNQLEQEILAEDRKNAVRYQGEQERFNRDFNLANNREQKLAVLQNYIHKWNRIANDDNTSLEVQGAFHAFGGTAEGRDLKKQIYGLVQEFNLIPPSLLIEQEFLDELEL